MSLTHDELRLATSRRSLEDLNLLLAYAEETIGTPPTLTREVDAEGNPADRSDETPRSQTLEAAEEATRAKDRLAADRSGDSEVFRLTKVDGDGSTGLYYRTDAETKPATDSTRDEVDASEFEASATEAAAVENAPGSDGTVPYDTTPAPTPAEVLEARDEIAAAGKDETL